jgi:hypothetical protein
METLSGEFQWSSIITLCEAQLQLQCLKKYQKLVRNINLRGKFERFVDWRQCAAVMQREAVTVMPGCSGGGNVVMA